MGIDIGKIGSALGALSGGLDLQELQKLGTAALGGNMDLQTLQKKVQEDPKMLQTLASALGSMKAPDTQTLGSIRDAVASVTAQAPAEQVGDELRQISDEGKKDLGELLGEAPAVSGERRQALGAPAPADAVRAQSAGDRAEAPGTGPAGRRQDHHQRQVTTPTAKTAKRKAPGIDPGDLPWSIFSGEGRMRGPGKKRIAPSHRTDAAPVHSFHAFPPLDRLRISS